jgi:hypothetical protein
VGKASRQLDAPEEAWHPRAMKKFAIVIFLLLAGIYLYLPYRAVGKYRDAINAGDTAAVSALVDYAEFRKSLRAQLVQKTAADNRAAAVASIIGNSVIDKVLAELVSEQSIGKLLAIGKLINSSEPQTVESFRWSGIDEVTVRMSGDGAPLTFRLTSSGWKLTGKAVDTTTSKLQKLLGG